MVYYLATIMDIPWPITKHTANSSYKVNPLTYGIRIFHLIFVIKFCAVVTSVRVTKWGCHKWLCHTWLCRKCPCHKYQCHKCPCRKCLCHKCLCHKCLCHKCLCHKCLCHKCPCHSVRVTSVRVTSVRVTSVRVTRDFVTSTGISVLEPHTNLCHLIKFYICRQWAFLPRASRSRSE